ncbi:MAG: Na+/H+ antiporter NhaC, partial [Verrucomicrobiae bacterium]|nr:Na+/H+ antiporter NhaC [Verrucomicrobiae bacterium]
MSDARSLPRSPSLGEALLPVAAMVGLLSLNIFGFKGESQHLPLIIATAVAAITGLRLGHSWRDLEEGMAQGIVVGLRAILILMVVGILIGTWIAGGVVPLLICYGMDLLNPSYFLVAACLICALVSLATGSSWTTAGTVGVALIGVGQALGLPPAMTAGAIVSGAYFGDKMSPLSDTTNLAPAVAGAELFEHIRHMVWTTIPALLIALAFYWFLGGSAAGEAGAALSEAPPIRAVIAKAFNLNPLLLLPPVAVVVMVALRVPALPALLGGAWLGGLAAVGLQGMSVARVL